MLVPNGQMVALIGLCSVAFIRPGNSENPAAILFSEFGWKVRAPGVVMTFLSVIPKYSHN